MLAVGIGRGGRALVEDFSRMNVATKASRVIRWLPSYLGQRLSRGGRHGSVHLMIALADHFEPSIVPGGRTTYAPYDEQERRLENWCREYPKAVELYRDNEGRPFTHSYFYPAEQYDKRLIDRLAEHCSSGWGEIEIHLHHGVITPATAEDTRKQLQQFRDILACDHGALSYLDDSGPPRYAFVHGNFALANSAGGLNCGVDSEIQVLADTGCYADLTLPTAPFHAAQISKINSVYECTVPLSRKAAHSSGHNLRRGRKPEVFPLIVQGPLLPDFNRRGPRRFGIENSALTRSNPPSLRRLQLWKRAGICVEGKPDWLFIKLHCHSMDPTQHGAVLGVPMQTFLRELIEGAKARNETVHFVSAREMVNIILAACDGKDGNPGDYRDYRLRKNRSTSLSLSGKKSFRVAVKG